MMTVSAFTFSHFIRFARRSSVVGLVLIGAAAFADEAAPVIDFHTALGRALEKSPSFDSLKRLESNAKLTVKNSFAALLPELDLQAQHQYNTAGGGYLQPVSALSHSPWSNVFGVAINENLYDNGETFRTFEESRINRRIAELTLTKGRMALLQRVAKAYYDYSSSSASVELQKQEIETLQSQFRAIEGRYRQGVTSNRDYLRIKVQLQRAQISLATLLIALDDSKNQLRVAIGETQAVNFIPYQPVVTQLEHLDFSAVSREDTLDFRIAQLQDEVSTLKYGSAVRAEFPRLTLKANYGYNIPEYLGPRTPGLDDPYWNFQALIQVDYALWDWGIRHRNVEFASNQRQIEFNTQNDQRVTVGQDLNRLVSQAQFYLQSYHESSSILKNEQEAFESLNRGYREGKVSYLDLITALDELYSSRAQNQSLQFSLLKARADLAYYQGNLDDVLQKQ